MSSYRTRSRRRRRRQRKPTPTPNIIRRLSPPPELIRRVQRTKRILQTIKPSFAPYTKLTRSGKPSKPLAHHVSQPLRRSTPPPLTRTLVRRNMDPCALDCYKRHQRREVILAQGTTGTGRRYKKWGNPCR